MKKGLLNVGKALAILTTPLIMANCSANDNSALKFAAGGVTGLAIHEGSHYVAGKMTGMDPEYDVREPFHVTMNRYHEKKTGEKAFVSGAGLLGQTVSTEIILNSDGIPKDKPYPLGILYFNILNGFKNAIFPEFWGDGKGDVGSLDKNRIDKNFVRVSLFGHSLYSAYRLWNNKNLNGKTKKSFDLLFNPKEDGLEATVKYDF